MRVHTVFVILFALLCLCRIGDLCGAASEFIETSGLLSLDRIPKPASHDEPASAALRQRRSESLEKGLECGVEVVMLAGVCGCFFLVLKRQRRAEQRMPA
jgi:hypothetical protein